MNSLIEKLSQDLKNPGESYGWKSRYWTQWSLLFVFTGLLTYFSSVYFPEDIHLPGNLLNLHFWMEVSFWFMLAIASSTLTYLSSLPGENTDGLKRFCILLIIILTLATALHTSFTSLYLDFLIELNISQGPCGLFIFTLGALWAVSLIPTIKKAAPTNLALTGASLALSTGSATTMFMHLFCRHESMSHIFIWHFIPLFFVIIIFWKLSPRLLRW